MQKAVSDGATEMTTCQQTSHISYLPFYFSNIPSHFGKDSDILALACFCCMFCCLLPSLLWFVYVAFLVYLMLIAVFVVVISADCFSTVASVGESKPHSCRAPQYMLSYFV